MSLTETSPFRTSSSLPRLSTRILGNISPSPLSVSGATIPQHLLRQALSTPSLPLYSWLRPAWINTVLATFGDFTMLSLGGGLFVSAVGGSFNLDTHIFSSGKFVSLFFLWCGRQNLVFLPFTLFPLSEIPNSWCWTPWINLLDFSLFHFLIVYFVLLSGRISWFYIPSLPLDILLL